MPLMTTRKPVLSEPPSLKGTQRHICRFSQQWASKQTHILCRQVRHNQHLHFRRLALPSLSIGSEPISGGFGHADNRLQTMQLRVMKQTSLHPPTIWTLRLRVVWGSVNPACSRRKCSEWAINLEIWWIPCRITGRMCL